MNIVWMRHKDHGQMPCYDSTTVEYNKKFGWEVFQKSTWEERKAAEATKAPAAEKPDGKKATKAPAAE